MELKIRKETSADFPDIYTINHSAFGQENEAQLVESLRKNPDCFIPGLSLVADIDGRLAGYILLTKIQIVAINGDEYESLALAPVAVLPEYQNQGIGNQLVKEALSSATGLGYSSVIVLGHQDYYPRFGFIPAERFRIRGPFDVPSNVFMAIELPGMP